MVHTAPVALMPLLALSTYLPKASGPYRKSQVVWRLWVLPDACTFPATATSWFLTCYSLSTGSHSHLSPHWWLLPQGCRFPLTWLLRGPWPLGSFLFDGKHWISAAPPFPCHTLLPPQSRGGTRQKQLRQRLSVWLAVTCWVTKVKPFTCLGLRF